VIISEDGCLAGRNFHYIEQLENQNYDFEVYDADAPENSDQLDAWGVESTPVVQIISEDGDVLFQFSEGMRSIRSIEAKKKVLNDH